MSLIFIIFLINIIIKDVISVDYIFRKRYEADWEDLDKRPLPEWYDRAKVGIFVNWGVFSVPGYVSEWFWINWEDRKGPKYVKFMEENYRPNMSYPEFATEFRAEFFDAKSWADLFARSGARYVVFTSKHHDGFAMFPSKRSFTWNSVAVGPRRDIVDDLSIAVKESGLKFGLYYSLYEWFNPLYLGDKKNNFSTQQYPNLKVWPDLKQIVVDYEPSILWSDGDWDSSDTYWNSTGFISWLYNKSPVGKDVVVNDRWGKGTRCKHGDFYNCGDNYNPHILQNHKWENAFSLDKKSWGYRRNMQLSEIVSFEEILKQIITTVSYGGNVLLNVGPTKDGTISPIFEERLLQLGDWLKVNGEAIYGSSPWYHQNDSYNSNIWFTCIKEGYTGLRPTEVPTEEDNILAIYAIFLEWPEESILQIGGITSYLVNIAPTNKEYSVELLGHKGNLQWSFEDGITNIILPRKSKVNSTGAWTLKFST